MATKEKDKEIVYEIIQHVGVVSKNNSSGWKRELNLVAWNGNPAKYDFRDWDEEHKLMSRGVTFNHDEAKALLKLLEEHMTEDGFTEQSAIS